MADSEDDETARRVRKLVVEHAETRWLALHMDNDIQEIRSELREVRAKQKVHDERFDSIDAQLQEHTDLLQSHGGRFDSLDVQMRSLTQLIGQVLDRLPPPERNGD